MSTTATQIAAEEEAPSAPSQPSVWRPLFYCLILLLLPALFLLSSIPIVRSPHFPKVAADPFLLFPDYAFNLRHEDCGILIYGDSTAATGLDPMTIQNLTGLKTCNIAQSQSVLEIVGPLTLDDYLKHNKPPKFLVVQLAPETFARLSKDLYWPEGLTVLIRREMGPRALFILATHPEQSYDFAIWAIKTRVAAIRSVPDFSATEAIFRERRGLIVLPKPAEKACFMNWTQYPADRAWIRSLREKYSRNGTQVLVNVSPVPSCSKNLARISSTVSGLTDNYLPVYPIHLFCDLDRHLTFAGAERSSAQLARQILARERSEGGKAR